MYFRLNTHRSNILIGRDMPAAPIELCDVDPSGAGPVPAARRSSGRRAGLRFHPGAILRAARIPAPAAYAEGRGRLPWPTNGEVVTRFGAQRHPQFGTVVFRRGIEIQARPGEEIRAVDDGVVKFADWYKGYGKLVIIEHPSGFYSLYGHLSRLDMNKENRVQRGQGVGLVGDTGSSRGAKLYFEIRANGEAQDPLLWLAKR